MPQKLIIALVLIPCMLWDSRPEHARAMSRLASAYVQSNSFETESMTLPLAAFSLTLSGDELSINVFHGLRTFLSGAK